MGREVDDGEGRPPGTSKPRLFIRQMVLDNFKSYAGKQFIGPFHKVISSAYISWFLKC